MESMEWLLKNSNKTPFKFFNLKKCRYRVHFARLFFERDLIILSACVWVWDSSFWKVWVRGCEAALADGGRDRGIGIVLGSASWA